jgi:membrane protein implicated in regulation of membrane protease activity
MGREAKVLRRWIGVLALVAALAMLIAGETALQGRLSDLGFLIYWLLCLAFTVLAILAALLDFRALQSRVRAEQRNLFTETLKEIETDVKAKPRQPGRRDPAR